MIEEHKRLFFGIEIIAAWPDSFPNGRILREVDRHLTLAFLGDAHLPTILNALASFPVPPFRTGLAGSTDQVLFLPKQTPRVAAWQIAWWEKNEELLAYRSLFIDWLLGLGLLSKPEKRDFLSHVTIARNPTDTLTWERSFTPAPCFAGDLCLFESMGHSIYEPRWRYEILAPFNEIEHTADIAFTIRGTTLEELYTHAWLAISFFEPFLCEYFQSRSPTSLIEVIEQLNERVAVADAERGCPLKAISHHGDLKESNGIFEWEMIVDV